MTTRTVNPLAPVAGKLTANTLAFVTASREADSASTPFARSALAAIIGGLSSLAMTESHIVAAFGSPLSPSTGKPVKGISGLRNFEGGARLYQAWKGVTLIIENIDADAYLVAPGTSEDAPEGVAGLALIRKAVVAFVLNEGDIKSLFGAKGIIAFVKDSMEQHAQAVAKLAGVEPEEAPASEGDNDNAPQSLSDRSAAMLVALQAASDSDFFDASEALAALSDYIDTRWRQIADATAPDAGEADMADAVETLAPVAVATA